MHSTSSQGDIGAFYVQHAQQRWYKMKNYNVMGMIFTEESECDCYEGEVAVVVDVHRHRIRNGELN